MVSIQVFTMWRKG